MAFIPHTKADVAAMLAAIGVSSLEEIFDRQIPQAVRLGRALELPPGKPEQPRTEHLPRIGVPTVFTQGTSDPFGTIEEVHAAAQLVAAATEIVEIAGARHDLGSKALDVPALAVDAALRLLAR